MKKTIFCSNSNCKLHILVNENLDKLYIKEGIDKEFIYYRQFYVLNSISISFCDNCIKLLPNII